MMKKKTTSLRQNGKIPSFLKVTHSQKWRICDTERAIQLDQGMEEITKEVLQGESNKGPELVIKILQIKIGILMVNKY